MDYVWEIIQPYVAAILAALGSGGIITLIVRAFTNKMLKKNFTLLDGTYNVDTFSRRRKVGGQNAEYRRNGGYGEIAQKDRPSVR